MTQPEALRLADAIDPFVRPYAPDHLTSKVAAAELRRLHAERAAADGVINDLVAKVRELQKENTSLSAALASSCDEQRHELWESGGIAGCERARVAERQRNALLEALKKAEENGCATVYANEGDEYGERGCCGVVSYMPHADDCWVTMARAAIKAVEETE